MSDELRVQQLVKEVLDSERTPEEVCADCPELLAEVRKRSQQMLRMVAAELEAMFPTPAPNQPAQDVDTPAPGNPPTELPRIAGYEVEAVLGRGGMGIVYKARDLRLNRSVALKMLLAGAYAGAEERKRFLREAKAVAGLRHANLVQVYDIGEHEGRPYFTMEYVDGGSLAQRLLGTPQCVRYAGEVVATLAEAVQMAHRGGIIHRDLKPANILLQRKPKIPTDSGTGNLISESVSPAQISDHDCRISDFDPKIADFGLARHSEGGSALTVSGARMGTPSYMAPEQAMGKTSTMGPPVDIYALGAVLYELLTGRPPFRGETPTETELQVIHLDPVAPSRLNPRVPRDLETICLKCLRKAPEGRYATADALAEDLRRFERGEPIAARPAGLVERAAKWVRRHPTGSAILAASFLLAVALIGASWWFMGRWAHLREAIGADLKEAAELRDSARWEEARKALDRAEERLSWAGPGTRKAIGPAGRVGAPSDLDGQFAQARRDLDLVIRLDNIRLKRATRGELVSYKAQANKTYADAFEQEGLGKVHDPPAGVATAVRASAVRGALVAALDDWAICIAEKDQRDWLLEVLRQADPDPEGWRDRILDPKAWDDPVALAELAGTVPVAGRSVSLLLALGERLTEARRDVTLLLKRVQKANPADFWANLILGNALLPLAAREAEGYYRAALAIRPGAAVGYCAVGDALRRQNALTEATEYYERALQLDAGYARAHSDLGLTLQVQGRLNDAIACYRQAVQLDPDYALAHHHLASALRVKGLLDEAYHHCQQAIKLDPNNAEVKACLTSVLLRQGRGSEAVDVWRKAVDANPTDQAAWFGYAELYLFLGQEAEYRRVRRDLLDRFGATKSQYIAEPIGRACLLLPGTEEELRRAVTLIDRAVAAKGSTAEWIYRFTLFAKGLAEYRQGRWASAISMMQGEASKVLGPAPGLILAMAQHRQGQKEQACKILALAIITHDWSAARADSRDIWINHILRREAEALILPKLPAFLEGKYQPQDNDERLALVGVCQFEGRHGATARLYADAFAADPQFADDLAVRPRYHAACAAAQAGCGLGADAAGVEPRERARWRQQAREWLQADLAAWIRLLDSDQARVREGARKALSDWREDPDLPCVRDPGELNKLAADERTEFVALWADVAAALARTEK
jgi:serine/threonine-protein kinase